MSKDVWTLMAQQEVLEQTIKHIEGQIKELEKQIELAGDEMYQEHLNNLSKEEAKDIFNIKRYEYDRQLKRKDLSIEEKKKIGAEKAELFKWFNKIYFS